MPVWMTTTGPHGSIQVFAEERIPLKSGKDKWVPGLRIPLQRAWMTGEIEASDGMPEPLAPSGDFSRLAPEFVDSEHLPPGVMIDLKKVAPHHKGWEHEPLKALETWLDSDEAKQYFGLERGDPRGKKPLRIKMTAEDYAKFQKMKEATGLDTKEVVASSPAETGAQKVVQGTRVSR